jgi:competence protein ComEC
LVLKITYRQKTFLFTGDIELTGQTWLLEEGGELRADVLKMPHHGSRVLLTDLLDEVDPELAVISVGAYNTFGHPAGSTLESLKERRIAVYRTDTDGAVIVRTDGNRLKVETAK